MFELHFLTKAAAEQLRSVIIQITVYSWVPFKGTACGGPGLHEDGNLGQTIQPL